MIDYGDYDDLGQTRKYLSIDLTDKQHPNRVIDIIQTTHPLTQQYQYKIKAQWSPDKFHPTMCLSQEELEEFSSKLNQLINDVKSENTESSE